MLERAIAEAITAAVTAATKTFARTAFQLVPDRVLSLLWVKIQK